MDPHYAYMQTMTGAELRWAYGWVMKKKLSGKWREDYDRQLLRAIMTHIEKREMEENKNERWE